MQNLRDYADSIRYLEELSLRPLTSWREAELRRMVTLFQELSNPQRGLTAIQVGGTTGKGSTTTMAAAILRAAGYVTGTFTSPHLQSYRERIAINGAPVDRQAWLEAMRIVQVPAELMAQNQLPEYTLGRPAFLEVLWAMAALIFRERNVRCAVLETGVGGRIDPVTVNTASVAVITNVSLDHTDRLGSTVEAIAVEKSGLIKSRQIVITAAEGSALRIIHERCLAEQASLWCVRDPAAEDAGLRGDQTVLIQPESDDPDALLQITTPRNRYSGLYLRLQGAHQRRNAACAIAAAEALAEREGLTVSPEAVSNGLAEAVIPGRMEFIAGTPPILLDGAKGPAAAQALAEALRTLYADKKVILILGLLNHKDIAAMTRALCPRAAAVIVAEPPWASHAAPAEDVAAHARASCSHVETAPEVAAALQRARELAASQDLLVVAGSLILVGAVRDLLFPTTGEAIP